MGDRAPAEERGPAAGKRTAVSALVLAALASLVLFANLGARYLWQDEAACAVLATRMMHGGKPLAYDGRNLITMDEFRPSEAATLPRRTGRPDEAVRYFAEKGDFKADTTWIGQPWGQFVLAGISLELLGKGTVQARLPFALAGVLTVVVLFLFARARFQDPWVAWIAAIALLANAFWFLHTRQCRYYSAGTLLLLLTVVAYLRWQDGKRFGASLFVLSGWCWFHCDFGTVWPVFGILSVDALRAAGRRWLVPVRTFACLALSIAPFALYYEIVGRVKEPFDSWAHRFLSTVFSVNHFQLPLILLVVLALLWRRRRAHARPGEWRVIGLCAAIVLAEVVWMPTVGPLPFYRYVVALTPLSCLLTAYALVGLAAWVGMRWLALVLAAVTILTPWLAAPLAVALPRTARQVGSIATLLRPELRGFAIHLLGFGTPDPNRRLVEFLKPRLRPGDEILVNYEDIPLMFYTDAGVRGGIPAFRVLDPDAPPPRFAVIRASAQFVHWAPFKEEFGRYRWRALPVEAPDIPWGNNPDTLGAAIPGMEGFRNIQVYERVDGQ